MKTGVLKSKPFVLKTIKKLITSFVSFSTGKCRSPKPLKSLNALGSVAD